MRRIILTTALVAALATTVPATSRADYDMPANGTPSTCLYERWYPGAENCNGEPWVITIRQECKSLGFPWFDRTCRKVAPKKWRSITAKRHGWTFVSQEFADALAEGESAPPESADTRDWERCRTNRSRTVVVCPDGFTTRQ